MFEEGIKYQIMIEKYQKELLLEAKQKQYKIHQNRIKASEESYIEYEGINIANLALKELEKLGFKNSFGSKCISEIVELLFHERKVIDKSFDLYDFEIERNNHYYFLGYGVNHVLESINKELEEVGLSDISKNKLYYDLLDRVVVIADELKEQKSNKLK